MRSSAVRFRPRLLALVALLVAGACSAEALSPESTDPPSSTAAPTTAPPPTTPDVEATAEDPLRVLIAGDSQMRDLAPVMDTALTSAGGAVVRFDLVPQLPLEPADRAVWSAAVEEFAPDVVVFLTGYWELVRVDANEPERLPAPEDYAEDLDAFLTTLPPSVDQVLWLGTPITLSPSQPVLTALNERYAAYARTSDRVTYLPLDRWLSPDGSFIEFLTDEAVGVVRVRQTDGLHLCEQGQVIVARGLLAVMGERYGLMVEPTWPVDWLFEVEDLPLCPPPPPGTEAPPVPPTLTDFTAPREGGSL